MKSLLKKGIITTLMLAMLVQMTGSAFAAEVSWISDGKLTVASVIPGTQTTQQVVINGYARYHTSGTAYSFDVEAGTSVTCTADVVFPNQYNAYLQLALNKAGLNMTETYTLPENKKVNISDTAATGNYIVVCEFQGTPGTWQIHQAHDEEGTPFYVTSGSFSFAPSSSTGKLTAKKV